MGKLRNMGSAKVTGNAGAWNFRNRAGEIVQAARSYTNSSKGTGASFGQRAHRVKLANLVAVYKAFGPVLKGAFNGKPASYSDFNVFVKRNLTANPVFLTKEDANANQGYPWTYQISEGPLPIAPAVYNHDLGMPECSIGITGDFSSMEEPANQTEGKFATNFLAAHPEFMTGDVLNLICLFRRNERSAVAGTVGTRQIQIVLDPASTRKLDLSMGIEEFDPGSGDACNISFFIPQVDTPENSYGVASAVVVTRGQGSAMQCSTSFLTLGDEEKAAVLADVSLEKAMKSYGYQDTPLLGE